MSARDAALEFAKSNQDRFLEEYKSLLRMPSISTLPEHKEDVLHTAEWLAEQLKALGLAKVSIMPTDGHPVVYAESAPVSGKPVVLVYGHYDVQPVDPLNELIPLPVEPEIRGDYLHARGASDMN